MKDPLYEKYLIWLKETHDLSPHDLYMGISELDELVAMRDEYLGRKGDTLIIQILKKEGAFEKQKEIWAKFSVLTFDEYKNVILDHRKMH
jgi:hypothetical protein